MVENERKITRLGLFGGLLIVVGIIAVIVYFGRRFEDEVVAPADGEIVAAFVGDLSASAAASGQVLPQRTAALAFESGGRLTAVNVRVGDTVEAGDVLAQLDTESLALDVANAEQALRMREADFASLTAEASAADIAAAEANVESAQAALDSLLAGARPEEIAAAEAEVRAARAGVGAATAQLNGTRSSVSEADIEAARARLVAAEFNLERAQEINDQIAVQQTDEPLVAAQEELEVARTAYNAALAGPTQDVIAQSQSGVSSSAAQQQISQASLDALLEPPSAARVAGAEATLAQAQANLDDLLEPATTQEIEAAEAELRLAELSLAAAEERLEKASLIAPFSGVVTAVTVAEGEVAAGAVVELVDLDSLEVVLSVDEIDIGSLAVGQPAVVTLESFPDAEIDSQIISIAPSADSSVGSGIVTYDVRLGLDERGDLPVRVGMTANASLVTAERDGVLLVPNRAIRVDRQAGTFYVNKIEGEGFEEVEVSIGLRDNSYTQINSGLDEGDEVLIGTEIPRVEFGPPGDD